MPKRKEDEDSRLPEPKPARDLPDPAICRAEDMTLAGYAACLVDNPRRCRYALSFGYRILCRHPQHKAIVARTQAQKRLRDDLPPA